MLLKLPFSGINIVIMSYYIHSSIILLDFLAFYCITGCYYIIGSYELNVYKRVFCSHYFRLPCFAVRVEAGEEYEKHPHKCPLCKNCCTVSNLFSVPYFCNQISCTFVFDYKGLTTAAVKIYIKRCDSGFYKCWYPFIRTTLR